MNILRLNLLYGAQEREMWDLMHLVKYFQVAYINVKLEKKVFAMNESGKKVVVKTWARASMISPDFVPDIYANALEDYCLHHTFLCALLNFLHYSM